MIHVGTIRTALFNYLYAQKTKGSFILRIEDTDLDRSTKQNEQLIYDGLRWMGIQWDEGPDIGGDYGPYRQMERLQHYEQYAEQLLQQGKAYYCYETAEELAAEREAQQKAGKPPKYSRKSYHLSEQEKQQLEAEGRPKTVRFLIPETQITLHDQVRGTVTFDSTTLSDPIIIKSNGIASFNFANVIDDYEMNITHVIRGEEHFPNLPIQYLLYQALDLPMPQFAHISLILNPDRTKMSKRRNEGILQYYRDKGYLPEAMVNFLALLGWSPGDDREIFTHDELIQAFSLEGLQPSPATLQEPKLEWFNGLYIRELSLAQLREKADAFIPDTWKQESEKLNAMLQLVQERVVHLSELPELIGFAFESITPTVDTLLPKKRSSEEAASALQHIITKLQNTESWEEPVLETTLRATVEELEWKTGELFMLTRIAITGSKATPPLFATMHVLGKELTLQRLQQAQHILNS
jgi:glutamyl-tRNA synthetase